MYTHALLTDLYELTMAAGYFEHGKLSDTAAFDLYFRKNPFKGGYAIAAGLENAIQAVLETGFSPDDIEYLRSFHSSRGTKTFSEPFLHYLSSYRFNGTIKAVPEGTVVFALSLIHI
jgi:nicotinate phosphoribosyltransferase